MVPPLPSGAGRRLQPARGWLLLLALALCGLALALWAAFLAGALAGVVLPVALWGLVVPL